ncbi:long-chain-fatty-acid--CoA ligase-like [Saccostrea cucullata]|uniref:long-chain-fatty-acid--CoA ligase-like n=1 Tax=Saccostrea cuccullata TaxID=36930 RepID=UPI002ED4202B
MGRKICFKELDSFVNSFARALMALGVQPGDKVALCLPNIPQTVIANLAILRIGAVAVQNNPLLTDRELEYQLSDSEAKAVICLSALVDRVRALKPGTRIEKIIDCRMDAFSSFSAEQSPPVDKKPAASSFSPLDERFAFEALVAAFADGPVADRSRWDAPAALIYTGGTTGVSKGVLLSNANLSSNVQQFAAWLPDWAPGEASLVGTYPIFHSAGFSFIQNFTIWKAFEHIMVPKPEPRAIMEIPEAAFSFDAAGGSHAFYRADGGAGIRRAGFFIPQGGFFRRGPPFAGYQWRVRGPDGPAVVRGVRLDRGGSAGRGDALGRPGPAGDGGRADSAHRCAHCGPGDRPAGSRAGRTGEIVVKGPQVMPGYYKRPEETRRVLQDGWLRTGDIGRFDADGYLTVVDRAKDVIIAGGFNVYPVEIDAVLTSHPKVREACAVGVPDAYRGRR